MRMANRPEVSFDQMAAAVPEIMDILSDEYKWTLSLPMFRAFFQRIRHFVLWKKEAF
jgi:hypothetical protein